MKEEDMNYTSRMADIAAQGKGKITAQHDNFSWEDPIPLQSDFPTEFPTECLPDWLANWVNGVARMLQVPVDGVAMLGIGAISTGIMRKVNISPMPGMVEPTGVYIEIIADVGSRKSPMFKVAVKPIEEYENEQRSALIPTVEADEAELGALIARQKQAQQICAKAKLEELHDSKVALRLATDAISEFRANMTRLPKLITDNTTSEKLGFNLANNDERLAIMSADTDLLSIMAGKYTGMSDFGIYLNAHAGDRVVIDRMSRELVLESPQITCAFTIQPSVLRDMKELKGAESRGLIARFWYCVPINNSGTRTKEPVGLPERVRNGYSEKIKRLLALPIPKNEGVINPHVLTLTKDAQEKFWQYYLVIEKNRTEYGTLSDLPKGWSSKLEGTLARLTAILHMGDNAGTGDWRKPIEVNVVDRAFLITKYLIKHARIAADIMHQTSNVSYAVMLLDWIIEKNQKTFSKRDAFRSLHRRFKENKKSMNEPLNILEEHHYIRQIKTKTKKKLYSVNPKILSTKKRRQWRQLEQEDTVLSPLAPVSEPQEKQAQYKQFPLYSEEHDCDFQDYNSKSKRCTSCGKFLLKK